MVSLVMKQKKMAVEDAGANKMINDIMDMDNDNVSIE